MNRHVKLALAFVVVLALLALAELLGIPPLTTPGYLVVRTATHLPDPYPIRDPHAPHRAAMSIVSDIFWAAALAAWFAVGQSRARRAN